MANLNNQETKPSQHITIELPSLTKIPKIHVKDEPPIPDILSNKMMIKHELVEDLDCQETKSNQNVMVQLPTFINTVKKEDSWPEPSRTVVIKRETDDDKRFECSDDEGDHKIDRTKIMLDNVLQNMFVAKEQGPTVSTCHPKTVKLPSPADTTVNVKNENPPPKPLLTEEISIKIESVNDLDDKKTTSRQNIIVEIPPSIDPTVPIKDEDADDEDYKIDLSKIMLHNVLQNMFVAKPPAPAVEEVSPSVEQPASLLRQLLAAGQRDPVSVGHQPEKRQENTEMTPAPVSVEQKTDVTEKKKRDNSNRPYNFQCAECGKKFRDKFFVRKHIESVHLKFLETCGVCNKSVGAYYLKRHMEMHKKGVYCEPCSKWFCLSSYKAHMKTTMTHVRPEHYRFTCEECGMKFHRNVVLTRHINRVHLKQEKPHKCPQCPAAYEERRSLATHVQLVHERSERPRNFVCDHCGAAMYTKRNLVSHMVRHSGARPHVCKVCGAAFGYSGVLATHMKLKHGDRRTKDQKRQVKDKVKKKRQTKDKGETSLG